jgi:hypothetical protein
MTAITNVPTTATSRRNGELDDTEPGRCRGTMRGS